MKYIFWISVSILVGFHAYLISSYSVNVPHWDDYGAILEFNNAFTQTGSAIQKLGMLLMRHNEHRIFLTRIVSIIDYWFFGSINFVHLIWAGNLLLISTLILIVRSEVNELKFYHLIPIPFLILNIQSFENFIFPMASIQNIGVIFLTIYSLYILSRPKVSRRNIAIAFILAVVATFSSGNGFLGLLCGMIILLMTKQSVRILVLWGIGAVVVLIINFQGGHFGFSTFDILHQKADILVSFFLVLIGSSFATIFDGYTLCVFTGFGLLIIFLWLMQKKLMKFNPFVFSVLLFLFLSVGIISLFRIHLGTSYAISERYRIYSFLICVFIYLGFVHLTINEKQQSIYRTYSIILLVTVFALFNYGYSYVKMIPSLSTWKQRLITSSIAYYENNDSGLLVYPFPERAAEIISTSSSLEIYQLPYLGDRNIEFSYSLEKVSIKHGHSDIDGWAIYKGLYSNHVQVEVIFRSKDGYQRIFKTQKVQRPDISALFGEIYSNSGFRLKIDGEKLEKGKYEILIKVKIGTIVNVIETEKEIFWK